MREKEQITVTFDEVVKYIEDAIKKSRSLFNDAPSLKDVLYHLKIRRILTASPKDKEILIADRDWKRGVIRYCGYFQEYIAKGGPINSDPV